MSNGSNPPLQFSCQEGEPLLKLETGVEAPVLNYSLPQDTSFTTYGTMNLNINSELFTEDAKLAPTPEEITRPEGTPTDAPLRTANDFLINFDGTYNSVAWSGAQIFDSPTKINELKALVTTGRIRNARTLGRLASEVANVGELTKDILGGTEIPQEIVTWDEVLKNYLLGYNPEELARKVNQGYSIQVVNRTGGGKRIVLTPRPTGATPNTFSAKPTLYIVEEYVTISYARDYGAGKTLQIHSLFPGEKTTMTIKTFKEIKTLQSRAENVIDSFSQESADELENLVEAEASVQESKSTQFGIQGNAGVSFGPFNASVSTNYSTSATRNANTRNLSKALSKSVDKSNSSRQININTSTQENSTESEEIATVRQFENVNKSKVLNLAFRELLQEYITIMFLNDIKIGFCNGHAEMTRVVSLEEIDLLLDAYIISTEQRQNIKNNIKMMYRGMFNEWANDLNPIGDTGKDLIDQNASLTYLTKNKTLKSTYRHKEGDAKEYEVPGIILNVRNYTLRTPAVVVDAFLGHGDALDCYAMKLMEADLEKTRLENEKRLKDMGNETLKLQNEATRLANEEAERLFRRQQDEAKMNLIQQVISELGDPKLKAEYLAKLLNPAPKEVVTNTLERIENNRV
jgi:hypothetical protein